MILAKPLKPKELGRLPALTDSTGPEPNHDQSNTNIEPISNQTFTAIGENKLPLIFAIIRDGKGLTVNEVYSIAAKFCQSKRIIWDTLDVMNVRGIINLLEKQGKVTRIKIKEVLHFFPRI